MEEETKIRVWGENQMLERYFTQNYNLTSDEKVYTPCLRNVQVERCKVDINSMGAGFECPGHCVHKRLSGSSREAKDQLSLFLHMVDHAE